MAFSAAADPGEPQHPCCLAGPRFTGGASSIPPTAQRSPRRVPAAAAAKAAMSKSFPGLPQGCDAGAKSNKGCSITSCLRHVSGAAGTQPQRLARCPGTRLRIVAGRGRLRWGNMDLGSSPLSCGRGTSGTRGPAAQPRAQLCCCEVWVLPAGAQPR